MFNYDGRICLLRKDNSGKWKSKIVSRKLKPNLMLLQNDGNLVVYNECGNSIWKSKTRGKCGIIPGMFTKYVFLYMFTRNSHYSRTMKFLPTNSTQKPLLMHQLGDYCRDLTSWDLSCIIYILNHML